MSNLYIDNLSGDSIVASSGLAICDDRISIWAAPQPPICETFICPSCGAIYIADSSGFVPNCKNCGSIMQRERGK